MNLNTAELSLVAADMISGKYAGDLVSLCPGLTRDHGSEQILTAQRLFFDVAAGRGLPAGSSLVSISLLSDYHRITLSVRNCTLGVFSSTSSPTLSKGDDILIEIITAYTPISVIESAFQSSIQSQVKGSDDGMCHRRLAIKVLR